VVKFQGVQEVYSIMLKKTVQGLVALAMLLVGTGAAQARDFVHDLKFDVFLLGGGSTMVDPTYFNSAGRLFHSRFEIGPKYNIGVAVPYGKIFTIETAYSAGPNNLVVSNQNIFPHVGVEYPVRQSLGSISGVFHAPFTRFHMRPYGALGVEYDRFTPTAAAVSYAISHGFATTSTAIITHNDKAGMNFGGGLDRKLTKRLTFRIDLRDHITGSPAFGLPPKVTSDSLGAAFPTSDRSNNIEYTVGILFHVGKL
jgi:opacity protein-like surface antigen